GDWTPPPPRRHRYQLSSRKDPLPPRGEAQDPVPTEPNPEVGPPAPSPLPTDAPHTSCGPSGDEPCYSRHLPGTNGLLPLPFPDPIDPGEKHEERPFPKRERRIRGRRF